MDVLLNVLVLAEGFDCPTLKTVLVRPGSRGPTMQMVGRSLRKHPEKPFAQVVQAASSPWPFTMIAPEEAKFALDQRGQWVSRRTADAGLARAHIDTLRTIATTQVRLSRHGRMDNAAIHAARRALSSTEAEIGMIAPERRPTLTQPNPSLNAEKGWAEVLGMVLFVPVMCGVGGVEQRGSGTLRVIASSHFGLRILDFGLAREFQSRIFNPKSAIKIQNHYRDAATELLAIALAEPSAFVIYCCPDGQRRGMLPCDGTGTVLGPILSCVMGERGLKMCHRLRSNAVGGVQGRF